MKFLSPPLQKLTEIIYIFFETLKNVSKMILEYKFYEMLILGLGEIMS